MRRWKLILYALLICLPAALAIGIGGSYLLAKVPRLERNEQRRITMGYRAVAERLRTDTGSRYVAKRRPDWVRLGKIQGAAWGRSAPADGRVWVWYRVTANRYRIATTEAVVPEEFWVLYIWGGAVAAILAGLSALAVWGFVRFMKERDDFLAATAHDLTTPLVGLRLTIGRNDDEAKNLNERMLRLVQNLKDFLKLGGRPKPKRETFSLAAACREAYALFAADYRDLFDGEDVVFAGEEETEVCADETLTVQVLWNLLGNDLKYAAPYGRVDVRFAHVGRLVTCEVSDTGPGMTRRQMRKAFDRYYRARTALRSGKGGFGIGLCTARDFARAMGGDLTVRANGPKGCVFTLSLPAAARS